MKRTHSFRRLTCLALLMSFAAFVVATAGSAAVRGLPPSLGKACGHVKGASWKFEGQTGSEYNVVGMPAGSCAVAMKSVGALTRQKAHAGAFGANTLSGPNGFNCAGSGIPLAHAGFCGKGPAHFTWAPQVKR
jgi:hypothetical protein